MMGVSRSAPWRGHLGKTDWAQLFLSTKLSSAWQREEVPRGSGGLPSTLLSSLRMELLVIHRAQLQCSSSEMTLTALSYPPPPKNNWFLDRIFLNTFCVL